MIIKQTSLAFLVLSLGWGLYGQETAERFFDKVSEHYGTIQDYEGDLSIIQNDNESVARVSYKNPNKLHLAFSKPNGQVININGYSLEIYDPAYRVSFKQDLRNNPVAIPGMNSSTGLALMKRSYSIAYLSGPGLSPLDEGSSELVTKLRLVWYNTNEGFRTIYLYIGQNNMIRRIHGVTPSGENIIFNFTNIVVNRGIPDSRFDYNSPAEGNTIEGFLYDP